VQKLSDLTIIKLGGSVITHKDKSPPEVNKSAISRIVKEINVFDDDLILVLGGGSFGHQTAHKYGYGKKSTPKEMLLKGIGPIRENMTELSTFVSEEFTKGGIRSVVLPPFTHVILDNAKISSYPTDILKESLNSGYRVITHGDVCFDKKLGASILSGDTIIVYLAEILQAKRLLIGTNVDGVLEQNPAVTLNPKLIPIIDQSNKRDVLQLAGDSNSTDVTGGMLKKITELLNLAEKSIDIYIFNLTIPGRLNSLLNGKSTICTTFSL
jgi:isopentenyl phosphate kinase